MFSSIVWESLAILQQASPRAKLRKIFHGKSFLPFLTSCSVVIPPLAGCEYLYVFHWLSSKNNNVVENRSGSLPEVLDVTALRELVTGNLEKLDRPWKVDVSYFLSFNGLLFFAFKKIEAHLLTSIFHSEYSNPAKKTPSCKLLGRQQLGVQSAVLDYNSTAKICGSSQSHPSFSGS